MIGAAELRALLPLMLVALTAIGTLLLAGFRRDARLAALGYQGGLLLTLLTLPWALPEQPLEVTPLLRIDGFFGYFAALFVLVAMAVGLMMQRQVRSKTSGERVEESYVLLAICLLGALVLAGAQHFAALFVGLELISVASFALVAYPCGGRPSTDIRQRNSLEAGLKYLVLSSVASGFLLFGIGCLYLDSGSLAFAPLPPSTSLALPGLALLLVGVAFKLALVPFHFWSPDIYQGAPTPVAALVATLSKGALFAVMLRYLWFGALQELETLVPAVALLASLSMLGGNLLALRQRDIKRLLAYSSIAHLGYLLLVLLAIGHAGVAIEAGAFYVLAYSLTTLGAFALIGCVCEAGDEPDYRLEAFAGLIWRAPLLGASLMLILLSLAGIPLTVGFIGKFYIVAAGVDAGLWWLLAVLVAGSAIGLYYYLRIILIMLAPQSEPSGIGGGRWLVYGLTLLLVLLGVYPLPVLQWLPVL
ncbi:NADH-quinone oxidoreductase subunit N [Marinobacterium nitratireducens]|uniref:NADH-quinone oxidoreductase subunit N n=1 Tax=Marinobacterium nitratireducens TaxID=518897 RepID=A0A917Z965_9GAMM|nr:NADH-quinone oxidoreductase subunit N [Marinobacterium nitratireducens]GGO78180.1 NADH-quinone oxidoreductase subunit N [Marinobacterium nitratireducens]